MKALLYLIPGAKSFEDTRTINGIVFHSYKEVVMKLGLEHDEREYYGNMKFSNISATPYQLFWSNFHYCILYVYMCIYIKQTYNRVKNMLS